MSTTYSQVIQKKKVPFLLKKDKNLDRLKTAKPMLHISTAFDTRFIFSKFEMKVFKTNHLFWFSGF